MRQWDNWDSYLDNDGNLLHGKIRFCKKGTTENIVISNSDGTPITNPIMTDILGRTAYQVFIDTRDDVSAYFYKYIGSGEMNQWPPEDYDPSRWAYQYEATSTDPVTHLDLDAEGAPGVNTVADLRATDPQEVPSVDGAKLMWVYGYYEEGDTSPVLYMWDPSVNDPDDGGAYIKATAVPGQGRWVLVSRELHFDVRHFGVFPTDDMYSTDTSYTSQIANCAAYLDKVGCDAWFPALKGERSWYLFDGTNTFAIKGDIYISDDVRFQCKSGTSGTIISAKEIHKTTPDLFVSTVNNGTGTLRADWVNISWLGGNVSGDARVGWVIDSASYPRVITGKEVKFLVNGHSSLQLNNCDISSNKKITGQILIQNSLLKTDFFADDYNWSNLTSIGNRILLQNCKDANTYILLKNKQMESNYGDLGEQSINADVRAGGTIENCYGTVRFISHGSTEMHNASLTVTGLTASDTLNLVDTWLTFGEATVLSSIALRRGSLAGQALQVLSSSYIDKADIQCAIKSWGTKLTIRNSNISGYINAHDLELTNNQIYREVNQTDNNGVINVHCVGNMFNMTGGAASIPARHYVHGTTAASVVNGIWANNGSTYDTVHWIRLDRTNLQVQDNAHHYTYSNNSEPYLMKYSGRNHPMHFPIYRANRDNRDLYRTTTIPFVCVNDNTYVVYVVPRSVTWKCFSVGRGFLARSGTIRGTWDFGIHEDDWAEHTNGNITIVYTWGAQASSNSTIMGGSAFGYSTMVSRDGDGEANYDVSFESANADHNPDTSPGSVFSNGIPIGVLNRSPYDGWGGIVRYPASPMQSINLFVHMDPDFQAGSTTPTNFG